MANRSITIGFSKPRGFFKQPLSWIIRQFEGSTYSHVYVKLKSSNLKNDFYYHASGSTVVFMGTDIFHKNNKPVEEHEFIIEPDKYYKTLDFAIDKVGKPYSISQLLGLVIMRTVAMFGFKIGNPFGKKGYICTELVAELLKDIYGKDIVKDLNSITLKDIKKLLERK